MQDPEDSFADIVVYATRAVTYLQGVALDQFARDVGSQDQVARCLIVIGEAARRIPEEARTAYPDVPWSKMIAMRNRLAHVYDDVDWVTVWLTVTRELPRLIADLEVR